MAKTPLAIRLVSGALGLGALAAVGWYTYQAFDSGLSLSDLRLNWLVAAFVLHVAVIAVLPAMWVRLLGIVRDETDSPARISDPKLIQAYSRSWLARYIPGRIWMFGGRVLYGRSAGISARSVTASTVLEAGISYSALGLLGAALLVGSRTHWTLAVVLAIAAFAVSLVGLRTIFHPGDAQPRNNRMSALLRKGSSWLNGATAPSTSRLFWMLVIFWVHAAVQLVFFIFVGLAVEPFGSQDFLLLAGAWGVGASIGYLSVFSAGGLGVRDGIALAFVGPAFTAPVAAAVVAVSRIILVLADLALVGSVEVLAIALKGRQARRKPSHQTTGLPVTPSELAREHGS